MVHTYRWRLEFSWIATADPTGRRRPEGLLEHHHRHIKCGNTSCSLHSTNHFVPCEIAVSDIRRRVDVMFVGEAPGSDDVEEGMPFVGDGGKLLRAAAQHAAQQLGVQDLNVAYSNVIRCMPRDKGGVTVDQVIGAENVRSCRNFLIADIKKVDPAVVVLLGAGAAANFDITDRSRVMRREIVGAERAVIYTWHPSFILRDPRLLSLFNTDIMAAVAAARADDLGGGYGTVADLRDPAWSRPGKFKLLTKLHQVEEYIYDYLGKEATGAVAIDTEAKNLNKRYGNALAMVQFATDADLGVCVPYQHPDSPFDSKEMERVKRALAWAMTSDEVSFRGWLAHNQKFEQILLGGQILDGRRIRNRPIFDTLGGAYLLDENRTALKKGAYSLKSLAVEWLDYHEYDADDLAERAKDEGLYRMDLRRLANYAGQDAFVTYRLFMMERRLAKAQGYLSDWLKLLQYVFCPVYRTLSRMETAGMYINVDHLRTLMREDSSISKRLVQIEEELRENADVQRANELMLRASVANKVVGKYGNGTALNLRPQIGEQPWVFHPNKQLEVLFFDVLKLDAAIMEDVAAAREAGKRSQYDDRITDDGKLSIDNKFFEEFSTIPEVGLIHEWRKLFTLKTRYIKGIADYVDPVHERIDFQDSRIRPDYRFDNTVTGRTSGEKPNPQNLPSRGTEKSEKYVKDIKSLVQAEQDWSLKQRAAHAVSWKPGARVVVPSTKIERAFTHCLVQADAKASEVRVWAILSKDPTLAKIFNDGKRYYRQFVANPTPENRRLAELKGDPHKLIASMMFGIGIEAVTKIQRTQVKSITFGFMYGRGVPSIAAQLKMTDRKGIREVQGLCDQLSSMFPVGMEWLAYQVKHARSALYAPSPIGRRRRLDAFMSGKYKLIAEAERMAKNSAIQSFSSDLSMIGASLFCDWVEDHNKSWILENAVHDSSVIRCPIDDVPELVDVHNRIYTTDTMAYVSDIWGLDWVCDLEMEYEISQAPRHGWGDLAKWDGTYDQLAAIVAGARDPEKSLLKKAA